VYNFDNHNNQKVISFYPKDLFLEVVHYDIARQVDIFVEQFVLLGNNY